MSSKLHYRHMYSIGCGMSLDCRVDNQAATMKSLVMSSTAKGRFELLINGTRHGVFFNLAGTTTEVNLNLNLQLENITIRVHNLDGFNADFYLTFVMEDNWQQYSAEFDRVLHKTLAT